MFTKLTRIFNAIIFAVLFSTVGIIGHASAVPSNTHHGSMHGTSPANCATVCLSAPTNGIKRDITPAYDEQDDEPEPPYYLQFESAQTGWYAEKSITPHLVDIDDKVPILTRCCVLRI